MKILIHAKNKNLDIESQAEILTYELEKSGHHIEWSNQTHPARLLLNKYDVVHILTENMPLSWKNFWIVVAAKTLNIPVVVTSYANENLLTARAAVANIQLNYFDAMSVPEASEIKNLRPFNKTKFIWPALLQKTVPKTKPLKIKQNDPINMIFHVLKSFSDLPDLKWTLDENIYIDATNIAAVKSHSEVRNLWMSYLKNNVGYKNAILVLNTVNLIKMMSKNRSIFIINYLKIHSISLASLIRICVENQSILVLNENQASGLPELWISGRNAIIQNFEKSFTYQLSLTELLEKSENIYFEKIDSPEFESKINELSRIYYKVKNQKDLNLSYANMPRRS